MSEDTIFALSSGPGRAGIAVIRVSGPLSHQVLSDVTQRDLPPVRNLVRRDFLGSDGQIVDQTMVAIFAEGSSFTGEAMAEIFCHGGTAIVHEVCRVLGSFNGVRPADPGEFTLRAFKSGRMDLTEAEGLADLISAQTEQQRREAMRLVRGEARDRAEAWRSDLIQALALLEVTIDWADEEVPDNVFPDVEFLLRKVDQELSGELALAEQSEKLRNGFVVAIVGPPNVGKSSLLNALAGREAAITSDIAGTTRDVIEVSLDINGLPVRFMDTAGLRETEDPVEIEGVKRATAAARGADLRILLRSSDTSWESEELFQSGDLVVQTKTDLYPEYTGVGVSVETGEGIQSLVTEIGERLSGRYQSFGLFGFERRRMSIETAREQLANTIADLEFVETEISAEGLRQAVAELNAVIGRVGVEDVLGDVFSRFCLGK